ncbi:hypothetical protein AVEN_180915-1 [Araneus ventricosus]|uniref:Uncharacterized protein n=1 Tax=Araneus ventricosus TaxID=182803 RepID=A0A4Y2IYC6_ARAVE|nr:hypothetical protein AVEN_180915-1 [Araneus ventricosus]
MQSEDGMPSIQAKPLMMIGGGRKIICVPSATYPSYATELPLHTFSQSTENQYSTAFVCEDATEHIVTEWLSGDTEANQLYTVEETISLVQNEPQDDSDLEETDEPQNVLVSHSEAANALEIALRYIEQSENTTSTDYVYETLA